MEEKQKNSRPFWNWGRALAAAILAFVLATLGVVAYISTLEYHLVSENHYENAVEYQQHIDRVARADALEAAVQITGRPESRDIRIVFPDSLFSLRPTGTVKLYRPSNAALDQTLELSLGTGGIQLVPAEHLEGGRWRVQITWEAGGEGYFKEAELFL